MTMRAFLLAAACCGLFTPVANAGGAPAKPPAEIALLPGWRTADGTHMAALQVRLAPGWKTYWRSPGDAGIPPRFDWQGSANIGTVELHWPVPRVYDVSGMRSIGYYGELVLPMEFRPVDTGRPITIDAVVEIGICESICVPVSARIRGELPVAGSRDGRIEQALAQRPATATEASVRKVACDLVPIADGLRVTARIDMPALGANEVAVFELEDTTVWISESEGGREGGAFEASSDLVPPAGAPFILGRSDIRITVLSEGGAVEIFGCPSG